MSISTAKQATGAEVEPARRVRVPIAYQEWRCVSFIHWRYPPTVVQALLPDGLILDEFDGEAWVTLTPFVVERMHLPGTPRTSRFSQTNLRTYVVGPEGTRGVWFFALDCTSLAATLLGRGAYFQPYHRSHLRVHAEKTHMSYQGARYWPSGGPRYAVELDFAEGEHANDDLAGFLTERREFFTFYGPLAAAATVEHERWPLQRASVVRASQTFTDAAGLPQPERPPVAHYSPGVDARLGGPRPIVKRKHPAVTRERGTTGCLRNDYDRPN